MNDYSTNIADSKCYNHASREAVARCPQCSHFFCRECITEHDDVIMCAVCLEKSSKSTKQRNPFLKHLIRVLLCGISFFVLWIIFYYFGQQINSIPDGFHKETLWAQ